MESTYFDPAFADIAVGVQLHGGETIRADWVLSAVDGQEAIFDLLGGRYADQSMRKFYATAKTFPSYVQVSLGVRRDLSGTPGFLTRALDEPLQVDPVRYQSEEYQAMCARDAVAFWASRRAS